MSRDESFPSLRSGPRVRRSALKEVLTQPGASPDTAQTARRALFATLGIVLALLLCIPSAHAQVAPCSSRLAPATPQMRAATAALKHAAASRSLAGLLQQVRLQNWGESDWIDETRVTYTYQGGNRASEVWEEWTGSEWMNASRTSYEYENGRQASILYEVWENGGWVPSDRELFSYENGDIGEWIEQIWNGNEWVNEFRSVFQTEGGFVIETISYEWMESDWVPVDRTLIGQEGDDFTLTYQEWDGSEWVNSSRSIFADLTLEDFYDSLEEFLNAPLEFFSFAFLLRLPDAVNQAWDGSEWVNESRSTSVRDDQDRQISVTFDEWLEDDWVPSNRNLFTYDNGHLSTLALQEYDGESGEWVTVSVESYEYDAGDNVAVIIVQSDFGLGDLQNLSRYLLTWSGSAAIGDERPSVTFALDPAYPNPFNPATVLTYHVPNGHVAVRVYSVLGRHVATLAEGVHVGGTYEVRFDGANLPSGPYIIRLEGVDRSVARVVTLVK